MLETEIRQYASQSLGIAQSTIDRFFQPLYFICLSCAVSTHPLRAPKSFTTRRTQPICNTRAALLYPCEPVSFLSNTTLADHIFLAQEPRREFKTTLLAPNAKTFLPPAFLNHLPSRRHINLAAGTSHQSATNPSPASLTHDHSTHPCSSVPDRENPSVSHGKTPI